MISNLVREVRYALLEKRPVKVNIAGHDFMADPNDLRAAAIKELSERAAAWAVIVRENQPPWAIPLVPGEIIDREIFPMLHCSFVLADNLGRCHVRIGDYDVRISQGDGAVFHGKVGYLLRRTKEEADEFTKAYSNSCW